MTRVEDIRPLRGRVILRELYAASPIVTPDTVRSNKRAGAGRLNIHRGLVLAMCAPARMKRGALAVPEYELRSEVLFVFALELTEEARTVRLETDRGAEDLVVVAQEEVIAVVDGTGASPLVGESRHLGRGR